MNPIDLKIDWSKIEDLDYDKVKTLTDQYIKEFSEKQERLIMSILKKQYGFRSIELDKDKIEVRNLIHNGHQVRTEYLFNEKKFLETYTSEITETNGKFNISMNYLEIP